MKKQILLTISILFLTSMTIGKPVFADGICTPIYGGGETCPTSQFSITKTVMNPATNQFVSNLGAIDPVYHQNDTVPFHLTITNNTNQTLSNLIVVDPIPSYLSFLSGPGVYDAYKKTTTITLTNLQANKSATYTITTKVVTNPTEDQGIICQNNRAQATLSNNTLYSSSQFCIQHSIDTHISTPILTKKTPKTGAELIEVLVLLPLGGIGFYLKRAKLV